MKRFARNFKTILESPNLPTSNQMISTYQRLSALPNRDLIEKYAALQQAQQSLAIQTGKIGTTEIKRQGSYARTRKEQIVEELMMEYLKMTLGKPSLVEKKSFWALINQLFLHNLIIPFSSVQTSKVIKGNN